MKKLLDAMELGMVSSFLMRQKAGLFTNNLCMVNKPEN